MQKRLPRRLQAWLKKGGRQKLLLLLPPLLLLLPLLPRLCLKANKKQVEQGGKMQQQ
jgi:hypothetical protein